MDEARRPLVHARLVQRRLIVWSYSMDIPEGALIPYTQSFQAYASKVARQEVVGLRSDIIQASMTMPTCSR